jgi:hypothetical protein
MPLLARETGLEPATSGVTGRRSNQLSYSRSGRRQGLVWGAGGVKSDKPQSRQVRSFISTIGVTCRNRMEFAGGVFSAQDRIEFRSRAPTSMAWRNARWNAPWLEAASALIILTMIVLGLVWNAWVRTSWYPNLALLLAGPTILLLLSGIYATVRPAPVIAEILFYFAIWMLLPIFATRLTYLCFASGHRLMDAPLSKADRMLSFNWPEWVAFVQAHPLLAKAQQVSYLSYEWQPMAAILVLAHRAPRKGNAELFMALGVSMAITLVVTTLLPAIGPGEALGFHPLASPIIQALETAPAAHNLPYKGIVSFPSFHTAMALLFVYAHRGVRWTFPTAVLFNALMLTSVPLNGDHYLVDMIAGAMVAVIGIATARLILRNYDILSDRIAPPPSAVPSSGNLL